MTQHFRPEAEAAKYRKPDSSVALAPVLGTSGALGHVLMSCKGYRAFDRHDRELGVFTRPADAVVAILNQREEGQPCCQ